MRRLCWDLPKCQAQLGFFLINAHKIVRLHFLLNHNVALMNSSVGRVFFVVVVKTNFLLLRAHGHEARDLELSEKWSSGPRATTLGSHSPLRML